LYSFGPWNRTKGTIHATPQTLSQHFSGFMTLHNHPRTKSHHFLGSWHGFMVKSCHKHVSDHFLDSWHGTTMARHFL
jgi:hypothetical protein